MILSILYNTLKFWQPGDGVYRLACNINNKKLYLFIWFIYLSIHWYLFICKLISDMKCCIASQRIYAITWLSKLQCISGASAREARQRSTMGKKNWKPIKLRKFGYDVSVRPSERTSVQTRGVGEGRLEIFLTVTYMGNSFLGGFLFRKVRKTLISVCHVNKRSKWLI